MKKSAPGYAAWRARYRKEPPCKDWTIRPARDGVNGAGGTPKGKPRRRRFGVYV